MAQGTAPRTAALACRTEIETTIADAWNAAGARHGLPPLTWRLGDQWTGTQFVATAESHPRERRRDVVEAWVVALGLEQEIDPVTDPLCRCGDDMVWFGTVDGMAFQLCYPAGND